jgi:hypothetical protein
VEWSAGPTRAIHCAVKPATAATACGRRSESAWSARDEGDPSADSDASAVARYLVGVMRGMAVEAAGGASGRELHKIVDVAMCAWPS